MFYLVLIIRNDEIIFIFVLRGGCNEKNIAGYYLPAAIKALFDAASTPAEREGLSALALALFGLRPQPMKQ